MASTIALVTETIGGIVRFIESSEGITATLIGDWEMTSVVQQDAGKD